MNLTIDRKTWLRGESQNSYLLRGRDKKMCCLGFYALKQGVDKDILTDIGEPHDLPDEERLLVLPLLKEVASGTGKRVGNSFVCDKLINANDSQRISEEVRESRITKWFAKIKVKVKFIH